MSVAHCRRAAGRPRRLGILLLPVAMAACDDTTAPAGPDHLEFVAQPAAMGAGSSVGPAVVVAVRDRSGETVWTWTEAVTVALESDAGAATLEGTRTVTPSGGTAVFEDLRISDAGSGYRLIATSGSLDPARSEAFVVHETLRSETLAVGVSHSCALVEDGTAYCWGANEHGQLGDGTRTDMPLPTPVATAHKFTELTAGAYHTCGLTGNGDAYCWGANESGELGAPTTQNCAADGGTVSPCAMAPVQVAGVGSWDQLSAGDDHTCGLTGGLPYCWGSNAYGQLGVQSGTAAAVPTPVSGGLQFVQVSAGFLHSCALAADGRAYCWGSNIYGEVGDSSGVRQTAPVPVHGDLRFRTISAGGAGCHGHTCAITTDGATYCWGRNYQRYVARSDLLLYAPERLVGDPGFASVAVGGNIVCGLTAAGALYCWGTPYNGQLGNGTSDDTALPTAIRPDLTFGTVRSGWFHTCAATTDGPVYCWGSNASGQLGNESNRHGWTVPVPVWK